MANILMIDDDPTCIFLFELQMESLFPEINITSFTNPEEALSSLTECSVDQNTVAFIDLNMPEMSGWEFFEKFKAKKENCRCFILTSSIDPRDLEKSNGTSGLEGFLIKPLTIEKIKQILAKTA